MVPNRPSQLDRFPEVEPEAAKVEAVAGAARAGQVPSARRQFFLFTFIHFIRYISHPMPQRRSDGAIFAQLRQVHNKENIAVEQKVPQLLTAPAQQIK